MYISINKEQINSLIVNLNAKTKHTRAFAQLYFLRRTNLTPGLLLVWSVFITGVDAKSIS